MQMSIGWCWILLVASFLLSLAHPGVNKFAGNLEPPSDKPVSRDESDGESARPITFSSNNQTESGSTVARVTSGTPEAVGSEASQAEPHGVQKKSSRPLGKAESVGFVPPPEEKPKEEAYEKVELDEEKRVVKFIPTLPPSIIQPGRMGNGSWFIMLYATWCKHSQAALTEFIHTVQYIVDKNITEIVVGKIDIIKHDDVAKHFRVKSTPTILFYRKGSRYNFDHPIVNSTNMINFMLEILSATVPRLNTTEDLVAFKKEHPVTFLIIYDEEIDDDWHRIFMKQAQDKCLKAKFAYTTDPAIVEEVQEFKTLPAIVVFKDGAVLKFKESLTAYALSRWILIEKDPIFPTVDKSTLWKYMQPVLGRRIAFLVVSNNSAKRNSVQKQAVETVKKLALSRSLHQKYQFGLLNGKNIPEMLTRSSFGELPQFFVFEPHTQYYYLFQSDEKGITEGKITQFLRDIHTGKERPLGGVTFMDKLVYLYQLGYATIQSMIVHKPYLTLFTGMSVLGVICFYVVICWQSRSNRPSPAEIRTRKAARARRKKEELARKQEEAAQKRIAAKEDAVAKTRESMTLRKRENNSARNKDQSGDHEDQSGTESGSTQSASDSEHSQSQ